VSRSTGIYGRDSEQSQVQGFLNTVVRGDTGTLVLSGKAGVGKSLLLAEAAEQARRRGLAVRHLPAGADPRSVSAPLDGRPTVLALDDADPAFADWLGDRLCPTRGPTAPVGIVLAPNPSSRTIGRDHLVGGRPTTRVEVPPLSGAAVCALVGDLIGTTPQRDLLDVVACADGNPRLVVGLVQGLAEEGRIGPDGDLVRLTPGRLPARARAMVATHVDRLSSDAAQLLRVGAVLGRTFQLSQAALMLRTSIAALLSALDEALAVGVLALSDEGVTFPQVLVWRVSYESIPARIRGMLHRDAQQVAGVRDQPSPMADLLSLGRAESLGGRRYAGGSPGDAVGAVRTLLGSGYLEPAVMLARSSLQGPLPAAERAALRAMIDEALASLGRTSDLVEVLSGLDDGSARTDRSADPYPVLMPVPVADRNAAGEDLVGAAELGPAERAIALLVADGLTNRQVAKQVFLSPHTVNYHLRRIYRKLGIGSRVELVRWVHGSGLAESGGHLTTDPVAAGPPVRRAG